MRQEYANEVLRRSREGYETIAADFSRTRSGTFWEELSFVRDLIPDGARVLDVGCGNGRFLTALEGKDVDYTGIDFSEGLVQCARERFPARARTAFLVGDALALPFPDKTFDAVVSFAVIHHIPSRAYRLQMLSELKRIAKDGAPIIITAWDVWHARPWHLVVNILKKIVGRSPLDIGDTFLSFGKEKEARFVHALTKREIHSLAKEVGLAVEELRIIPRPSGERNFFALLRK